MWSDAGCLRKPPGSEQSSSLKVRHTSFAIIGVGSEGRIPHGKAEDTSRAHAYIRR